MTADHIKCHAELTPERRAVVDDVCLYTISERDYWERVRSTREAALGSLHQKAIAAKAKWDASGDPADETAYLAAFERWIAV